MSTAIQPISEDKDYTGEIAPYQELPITALEAMTRAEVDVGIATAKRYPRMISRSIKAAKTLALSSPEVAASCFYTLPARAGDSSNKPISGPSIRLAEILACTWGNFRVVVRVTQEAERFLVAQAVAQDLEQNNTKAAEVRRIIWGRRGRYSDAMITQTANAACSIAYRNAVMAVVPRALWDDIYMSCRRLAAGEGRSMEEGRQAAMDWAKGLGVTPAEVFGFLGIDGLADLTFDHLEILAGIRTSLKDGETTVEEVFRPRVPSAAEQESKQSLSEKLRGRANKNDHPPVAQTVQDLKAAQSA